MLERHCLLVLFFAVGSCVACGSSASTSDGSGGAGGSALESGGTSGSGAGLGGSSGAGGGNSGGTAGNSGTTGNDAPHKGAVAIDFHAAGDCSGQDLLIYQPENAGVAPVNASGATAWMTDDGFSTNHTSGVGCIVHLTNDGTFMFDGAIEFDRPTRFSLGMFNHDASVGARTLGGFQLSHPDLPVEYGTQADYGGEFEFFTLEPGRVHGKLIISRLPNFDDDSLCEIRESYFAFENCDLAY